MPVRSSRVPAVRAATLDPEQHGTVRPPATETMLGPLPGRPHQGGSGRRASSVSPTCLSLPGPVGRAASALQRGQPGVQLLKGCSWEGEWLGQLPPSLPALLAFLLPR